jgi:peptidoglycan/xylan/chitin deacetylase (PgdA/CDA1 family)
MLKYQKILLTFITILVAVIIFNHFVHTGIWLYLCIITIPAVMLAYGSMYIGSDYYCKVLCLADTTEKKIALTFDDGPDKTITPVILDVLKKHRITAAFFCIGHKAEENPGLIRQIDDEGHIIGSHSYSHHFFFDLFGSRRMISELQKTESVLYQILNKKITMFRPPYGVTNPTLADVLKKMKYHVIGWSLRSKDTVLQHDRLFERVTNKVKPGDILIFHDTKAQTAEVLDKFIIFALENNYGFERLDRLLKIEPYE